MLTFGNSTFFNLAVCLWGGAHGKMNNLLERYVGGDGNLVGAFGFTYICNVINYKYGRIL